MYLHSSTYQSNFDAQTHILKSIPKRIQHAITLIHPLKIGTGDWAEYRGEKERIGHLCCFNVSRRMRNTNILEKCGKSQRSFTSFGETIKWRYAPPRWLLPPSSRKDLEFRCVNAVDEGMMLMFSN